MRVASCCDRNLPELEVMGKQLFGQSSSVRYIDHSFNDVVSCQTYLRLNRVDASFREEVLSLGEADWCFQTQRNICP